MNLLFRLLWTRVVSRFRSPCGPLGPVRTPFRVMPTDLDVLRHVNNGAYFSLLDLARADLLIRSGLLPRLLERGWFAVVSAESIRFRRSLRLFDRFVVETSVVGWDHRAVYIHHRFLRGDESVAVAFVAARFLRREGGDVAPAEILALTDAAEASDLPDPTALPEWARALAEAQGGMPA